MSKNDTITIWDKLPSTFEALKYSNFRFFWFGQAFSLVGIWMMMIAQGWLIYEITGSKFLLGLINAISGLPILLLTPFGGYIADHMNKKKLLILTQILAAGLSFLIGVLISLNSITFLNLSIIVFFLGIVNAVDSPARQAFVVDLVDKRSLGNAIAVNSLSFNAARVIGPALAGYLIGAINIQSCYYINSLSFVAVIIGLLLIKGDFSAKAIKTESIAKGMINGIKYINADRQILFSLILVTFTSIFIMPYAVLMPVFAKDILHVGAKGMGFLMSTSGIGALLGALYLAQYGDKMDLRKFILESTFIMSIAIALFSFSTSFYLSSFFLIFSGWGIVSQAAAVNTLIQKKVPNELRGRIISFYVMAFLGFMPVGAFIAGIGSHFIGAQLTLFFGSIISVIPAILAITVFKERNPDRLK